MMFLNILKNIAIKIFCVTHLVISRNDTFLYHMMLQHNFAKYFSGARVYEIVNNCLVFIICYLRVCKKLCSQLLLSREIDDAGNQR